MQDIKQKLEQIQRGEVPEKYRKRATGIVPCDWAEYSLGEIYKERKLAGDPKLPILTVSIHSGVSDGALNEDELGKKVKRIEDKTQYKTAKAGDLVFNMMRAWQGAIGVARSDGLVSPAYIVAKPEREIYPLFMDYYMKQPRMVNMIHRQSYGVTDFRLRLYWDSFAQIQVSLPPLAEQKRIVEILSTQDRIIELLEKEVEQLELLKKSYMQKMFPQSGSNEPEIRFPGFSAPWEQRKLGDVGTTYTGLSGKTKNDFGHGEAKFVTYMNVYSNVVADPTMVEPIEIDNKQKQVEVGDVFFTTSSETLDEVGMSSVLLEKQGPTYLNSFCFGYRPTEKFDPYYLAYMLRSEGVRQDIVLLAQGISR